MGTIKSTNDKNTELTDPEKVCLNALLAACKRLSPMTPSVQDVADEMKASKSTAAGWLKRLEIKGWVERNGRKSRTLRLVRRSGKAS